jgi:hypothetical protein
MFCEVNNVAVGSAFCQSMGGNGKYQPIAYVNKQLTVAERNYSTTERKCLAMVFSVKKFKYYLIYNPVVFLMDHMAIIFR